MRTTTIRISSSAHAMLKQIAKDEAEPMQSVLDRLLRKYRAEQLLHKTNAAFAQLRNNSEEWEQELEERAAWDQALADDLKDDMEMG
ncbi:MAG TPA: toxin-antitoxin system protein [Desulfonatronum sp.]|nr:toxin-antitoxin system protein [Desulfonatronum sp.]